MGTAIYYRDASGKEVRVGLEALPQKCGDCAYCSSQEEYDHYDDLDGWDVYYETITCNVNKKAISKFRKEDSLGYDYGYEDRVLGKKPDDCPLYQK